jgi:hypothetical protein
MTEGEVHMRHVSSKAAAALVGLGLAIGTVHSDGQKKEGEKRVGFQGTDQVPATQQPAIYVEPVKLTEVYDRMGPSLNIGAVVSDVNFGRGIQKAADVWGFNLDLFVARDPGERASIVKHLIDNLESVVIVDTLAGEDWSNLERAATDAKIHFHASAAGASPGFPGGMQAIRTARAELIPRIPKYDEILPIAFPISPMPDSFFQPSKFPYPRPLVRVERTAESTSASVHAHVSCNMVAQTGNMLHRTSSIDPNLFLMGMEGGNLSLHALPGAVDPEKVSAVMTSWVLAIRGTTSDQRDIIVENDGVESSLFKVGIHAPEELDLALEAWKQKGIISDFQRTGRDEVVLKTWDGADRRLRAGMFLVSSDKHIDGPQLTAGMDAAGRHTLDFHSTQSFIQQFAEISPSGSAAVRSQNVKALTSTGNRQPGAFLAQGLKPHGGVLTEGGTSVGNTVGTPLANLLQSVKQPKPDFQPYVMTLEGGFIVVTPEGTLTTAQLRKKVARVDLDLRGPLSSDQTILVTLEDGAQVTFRRTVLNFTELDEGLATLRSQGLVQDWKYEGSRGRGLNANVVLTQFLGKHRKFMSSLCAWPGDLRPAQPVVRFYVDGMQRLNFTFITRNGWRQEFVEVPLSIPPVPRDVALYTGVSEIQ